MKKIKTLYWVILVLTIILSINVIADTIRFANMRSTFEPANKDTYLGYYTMFVYSFIMLFLIAGLFNIQRALFFILKLKGFNTKSTTFFKYAGWFIITYGLADLIFQLNFINSAEPYGIMQNVIDIILVLLIGFGIYSFSEILSKGELLKAEQDLTI